MAQKPILRLEWTVQGQPKPQQRHRHTARGHVWDPSSALKKDFLQRSKLACSNFELFAEPLCVCLRFVFARPKAHFTSKGNLSARAPKHHVQTPDADNLAKFVLDSLCGTFFKDDRQVCELRVSKTWGVVGSTSIVICACE